MFVTNFLQKITSKKNNSENNNLLEKNNSENNNLLEKNNSENNNLLEKNNLENNLLEKNLLYNNKNITKNCSIDESINKIIDIYVDNFKNIGKIDEIIEDFYIDYENLKGKKDSYEKYKKILMIKLNNKYKNKDILVCVYKTTNNTINLFEVDNMHHSINHSINQNQDILYLIQYIWLKNNLRKSSK